MDKRKLLILGMLFLSACEATPELTVMPVIPRSIGTTAELENTVISWLTDYYVENERGTLFLETLPQEQLISSIESGNVEVGILGGEPPDDWFVTPLMREAIVVIVNPDIAVQSLHLQDLKALFSGKVKTWETLAGVEDAVQLVIPFEGSIFRDRFDQVVMKDSIFDPSSRLAVTPGDMLNFVRSIKGAVGFLPASQLGEGVGVVDIENRSPSDSTLPSSSYPLWVDLLATSPEEPVGHLRDFLVWLQGLSIPVQ